MNLNTRKKLREHFVGKPCSIFMAATSRILQNHAQSTDYFVAIVESVEDDGIFGKHPVTGCMNFYPLSQLVAICEEQVKYRDDPQMAAAFEKFESEKSEEENVQAESITSPYVDISAMEKLMKGQ